MQKQVRSLFGVALLIAAVTACQKSQVVPETDAVSHSSARLADGTPERDDTVTSASTSFEAGALTRQGLAPGAAVTTTLTWEPVYKTDGSVYRYYLRRDDNDEILAGVANNNGLTHPNRIFAFKGPRNNANPTGIWDGTVPFVLVRKYHGRDFKPAIATPVFKFGYPNQFAQAKFEPAVNGTVTVGDFTASQGHAGIEARVVVMKGGQVNGGENQYARTNGQGENGTLVGLAVLRVRTGWSLDGTGKIVNEYEDIPFVLIQHPSKGLTVQTRIAAGGINLMSVVAQNLKF